MPLPPLRAVAASAPAVAAPEILARLDRIDAQLAAISAVIGTRPSQMHPGKPRGRCRAGGPLPLPQPRSRRGRRRRTAAPEWRDEVSYTLNPGEGIEVKLAMEEGQTARFAWTANGSVVNFDLHGDGGGQSISYEQGRAVPEQAGELTAAFTGNHGWFWRNRTEAPVTVTLRTGGSVVAPVEGDHGAVGAGQAARVDLARAQIVVDEAVDDHRFAHLGGTQLGPT
jgi:hypothetical protein